MVVFRYVASVAHDPPTEYGFDALRTRRCECGAEDCTAIIEITWAEQDEVDHGAPELWIVAPGHEPLGARSWQVVRETDRFVVVEVEEAAN
jgi:hypothetical protein